MKQIERTIFLLRNKKKGITVHDFDTGFRLSAYILRLRQAGYSIETIREYFPNRRQRATYILLGEPKGANNG